MGLRSPTTYNAFPCRNEVWGLCKYATKQLSTSRESEPTRADRKAQLIKKVCVEDGKTRLLTSADRTENAVSSSHSLYYQLSSNK